MKVSRLKPIEQETEELTRQINFIPNNLYQLARCGKVVVKTAEAFHLLKLNDIIRCESSINYTNIILQEARPILSAKTLKDYEHLFQAPLFQRVHQSHLVNMDHIKRFEKKDGGLLIMDNGDVVPVSKRHKERILAFFR